MATERLAGDGMWPRAVKVGDLAFLSAHFAAPSDPPPPASGNPLVDDLERATAEQVLGMYRAIERTLADVGSSKSHILLMNGWFADYREWPVMNRIRGAFFDPGALPVCTGFAAAHLPGRGTRAMAEAIGLDASLERATVGNPVQVGSYAPGSRAAGLIFLGGEVAGDSETGVVVEQPGDLERVGLSPGDALTGVLGLDGWEGPIRAQALFVYHRIAQSLAAEGLGLDRIVKQTVYLRDLRDYPAFERQSREILASPLPATTVVSAAEYGHRGFDLEVEVVAAAAGAEVRRSFQGGPSACGPDYPTMTHAGPLSFLSGLVPARDAVPPHGRTVPERVALAEAQTHALYDQLERILAANGGDLGSLVRQVLFVKAPEAMAAVERAAFERSGHVQPATTFVGVGETVPAAAEVHLDATAVSLAKTDEGSSS